MSVISIMLHPERSDSHRLATQLADDLIGEGNSVRLSETEAAAIGRPELGCTLEMLADSVDLAVSIGGDGTMLRTFERVARQSIPVLGVNVGDLGYLTEFEADEAKGAIEAALNGALPVEERLMVQSRIERADGQNDGTWTGLNEAVLEKKSI